MTGCQTCGGYGMRHEPIAHGTETMNPADDVCSCGHLVADHPDDNEPACQVAGCPCEWFDNEDSA